MRILMISWEFPPYMVGGIGKHVAELVPALAEAGAHQPHFELELLTLRSAGGPVREEIGPGVVVHRADIHPVDPNDLFNSVMDINRTLEQKATELSGDEPYDLIHIHDWLVAGTGIALKHRWKRPLVATIHATERGRHRSYLPNEQSRQINQLEWASCFEAWRVIVCSGFMAGELYGYFATPQDKVSVIPNGVDVEPLQNCPPEQIEALRRKHAPNGERLLFFVGRSTPEKGLQVLLEAMPLILETYPDTRLLVAGKNSERMQGRVEELGIRSAVDILGFISDEERNCLYNSVDAAVFPSLYEPFGIVALEAMAAGCSVIVSDVGGLGEVIQHLNNGITVLANNPQSIAWGVERLFDNPQQMRFMRERAQEHVERLYTWDKIALHTIELYRAVVNERAGVNW